MNVGKFKEKNLKTNSKTNTPSLSRVPSKSLLTKYQRSDSDNKLHSSSTSVNQSGITNRDKYEINSYCLNKGKNAGERLYHYSKYLKLKKDNRRVFEDLERSRSMSPNLSKKAKSIDRDPRKFVERLYPDDKNLNLSSYEPSIISDIESVFGNKSLMHLYKKPVNDVYNVEFPFKPNLNSKSLLLASKMESPRSRLMSKNKKKHNKSFDVLTVSDLTKSNYKSNNNKSNIISNKSFNNNDLVKPTTSIEYEQTKNNKFCKSSFLQTLVNNLVVKKEVVKKKPVYGVYNQLYERGMEAKKKRSNLFDERKKKSEEEYKHFPYKPEIQSNCKGNQSKERFYDKNSKWKQTVNMKTQERKVLKENENMKECTFSPKIDPKIPNPDFNFINRHFVQTNNYIAKRREVLGKQEADKEYIKKKLSLDKNFKVRRTIVKEFHFHDSASKKSLIEESLATKNISYDVRNIRKKLHIEEFFDENSSVIIMKEPEEINYSDNRRMDFSPLKKYLFH
jgi:hypothetical protein